MSAECKRENRPSCVVVAGDSRKELERFRGSVDLIVTSPPYADARRKHYDSITPEDYPEWFATFHQVFWDALKPKGSFVLNIKDKVVNGVRSHFVWRTIDKLCENGWKCIDDYVWHKTNPMPGYWPTRLRDGWEYCFHLAKTKHPFMNQDAVRVPVGEWVTTRLRKLGNNDMTRSNSANKSGFGRDLSRWVGKKKVLPSNVISLALVGKNKGHPAVFPVALPSFFIKLLCPEGGLVLDPFAGSGSTAVAALTLERDCLMIDNNVSYCELSIERIAKEAGTNFNVLFGDENFIGHEYAVTADVRQSMLQLAEKHSSYLT